MKCKSCGGEGAQDIEPEPLCLACLTMWLLAAVDAALGHHA